MIELIDVTKDYPNGTRAVEEVSLKVEKGEIMILIGPSGCGKTTLLKTINRLIPHTDGRILIEDQDVMSLNQIALRRRIGYVIQQVGLFPHLNILENTTFVLKLNKVSYRIRKERAEELLATVGLPPEDYLYRFPSQLSGGQQQRIGVARALADDPGIILMDEPFGALDPITREQLQDEFLKLQKELNKCIVFVTHSMQEARKMGDRIAILNEGRLMQEGTIYELYKNPSVQFVCDFIGAHKIMQVLEAIEVKMSMRKDVPICSPGDPVEKIIETIDSKEWDNCFVIEESKKPLGTITREKLDKNGKNSLDEEQVTAFRDSVVESDYLRVAVEKMILCNCNILPVTDEEGKFKGMVSMETIYHTLTE